MARFIIARQVLFTERDVVDAESAEQVRDLWDKDNLSHCMELGIAEEYGDLLVHPEEEIDDEPPAPPIPEIKRLKEQVRILREALEGMVNNEAMRHAGQPEGWMTPTYHRAVAALEATKEA